MILIDARGHGGSDKPHEEVSYALDRRAADVTTVLDALGVEKAHFWGYSMGGRIGFAMARYAPHRVDKLVIASNTPFASDMAGMRRMIRVGITGGGDAFIAAFEKRFGPIADAHATRLRMADLAAYLAAAQGGPAWEDMLETVAMPCCIYAGDTEPLFARAKLASEQIPNARFFSLPGLSYFLVFAERSHVLPRVMEFLGATR